MLARRTVTVALFGALVLAAGPAHAQKSSKSSKRSGLGVWNVESMVERAADQIISRYRLNDQQAEYTRQLMSKRADRLLEKHEDQIRALFREAMAMRMMGKAPSAEVIKSWATRAMPVYKDAKKLILEGNEEWATILSPEQQRTHKLDLKMMEMDFAQYEKRLERWSEGGFDAKKDWVVRNQSARRPTPRSAKQTALAKARAEAQAKALAKAREAAAAAKAGQQTAMPPPGPGGPPRLGAKAPQQPAGGVQVFKDVELDPEHFWDAYTRDFTRRYRLDKAQSQQAMAILKDCKERARRHRDAHREDYQRLHKQIRAARAAGGKSAAANEELADLDAPINDLFEELKTRLDSIPTTAQIQKYQSSRQAGK